MPESKPNACIETEKGTVIIELFPEEAPKAFQNFVNLAGRGFYDGIPFHRVVPGFVVQGGDPNCVQERSSGPCGTGGPGYTFSDEPVKRSYQRGIVAMANAGPNTNGSQFFIMLADHPELPPLYTIFGRVIQGQDVVNSIVQGDRMMRVTIAAVPPAS